MNVVETTTPPPGWTAFPDHFAPDDRTLAEILDGGQAFRWRGSPAPGQPTRWTGVWADIVLEIERSPAGALQWRSLNLPPAEAARRVTRYFALETPWAAITDALPWRSDAHLARTVQAFPGLRLLRQPFGETLLGFLCSATKQIVQIKQMLALVAERHGALIAPGVHRLPTWAELAMLSEADLRRCQLGFRARYVHATARHLAAEPGWLEATEAAPYAEAHERLCALPGVGEKVADCVLLFGAGKLEAFPVDVWIARTLAERYDLRDWKLPALARFGRVHFGAAAGFAQQFLFAWERRAAGR
jgi:N-glycosylase/DNA lyase